MGSELKSCVNQLEQILSSEPVPQKGTDTWERTVTSVRAIISELDAAPNVREEVGVPHWAKLVGLAQDLAYVDSAGGAEPTIAAWCEQQWIEILVDHPQSLPALRGKPYRHI